MGRGHARKTVAARRAARLPGAAALAREPERWARYIADSLVETTLSRDVLLLTRIDKPALLRRLFELSCRYSGQILSYTRMLGQLQDAGNAITLAHYLDLLAGSGLVTGLQKFAGSAARSRGSIPKLQVLNTALMTAQSGLGLVEARADRDFWGRLTESAVGAHWRTALPPPGASFSTGASAIAKSISSCAGGGASRRSR